MIKEIKLTSLFGEKVERGQRLVKEKRISGDTPLVTAGEQNQGIAENICADGHTVYDNAITIDMFGNAFCRDYKFCADDNILILKNPAFSYNTLLYLAAAINKKSSRYSYAQQYRQKSYVAETIFLPVKTVFTPDYAMIENLAGGGVSI